jgi:hypothetical protein
MYEDYVPISAETREPPAGMSISLQWRVCKLLVPKRWSPNCRSALTRDRQCPRGPSRDLARQMADTRTMLTASWSLQRADHGEQRDAGDRRVEGAFGRVRENSTRLARFS